MSEQLSNASSAHLDAATACTLRLLDHLFGHDVSRQVGVRLWNGMLWPSDAPRPATLSLRHAGALRAAFLPGTELALAEAYLYDDIDIGGDSEVLFGLVDALAAATSGWRKKLGIIRDLSRLPVAAERRHGQRGSARLVGRRHSIERDRQAVTYHYDLSNDFYALWLDPRMVYSCAYFRASQDDLAAAQEHKLEYLCRKLRLRSGQRLLDIGCGWGGLVLYAAQHHGVDATGITLSGRQVDVARQRIEASRLAAHCRVALCDYRQVSADDTGRYDALVSVGMSEHVGAEALGDYFRRAWRLLKPGGVFLNHAIARHAGDSPTHGPTFFDSYVFPDADPTPLDMTLQAAERAGFEVRDVENLREHYVSTLRHWVRRLEAQHDRALAFVDEPTYRVWRLFMSGSAHGFATGRLAVYQTLLVKPNAVGHSGLPLTRDDWYTAA